MNARTPFQLQTPTMTAVAQPLEPDDEINLVEYWDIVVDNRWLVAAVTAIVLAIGTAYAFLARPIYEANLIVQVEDSDASAKSFLGDAARLFDVKTPAAAEIEIIHSRMIVGQAVDNLLLYITATPHYLPMVGGWLARHANGLSDPGFLGFGGYVRGAEKIAVTTFDVPESLEGSAFTVLARGGGRYTLSNPEGTESWSGTVGAPLEAKTSAGPIKLLVTQLEGKPGAEFLVTRNSRLATIEALQRNLNIAEKGRDSGIIETVLQGSSPVQLSRLLNEIGRLYVQQNVERKAAEAAKTLAFLNLQMPQLKRQLEQAEAVYNRFRQEKGTISLDDEAKTVLAAMLDLHQKLLDTQQKRRELIAKFTPEHPTIKILDRQIAGFNEELAKLEGQVHRLPAVQQDALRLQRDVQVNNDAYQNLQANKLQLQLTREGKIGNVRVIDQAMIPEVPVKPKRLLIVALTSVIGLLCGIGLALARSALNRGIRNPDEIENHVGLNVYSTIPLSPAQPALARFAAERKPGTHVLSALNPDDTAVESLRSLRTALQFAMLEAPNNRVLITGPTPGVGKSFVSTNFANIVAASGKRVLLIDADLRKGHLNHYFGVRRERGLSDVIAGNVATTEAIHREVLPNLDLLTTGVLPPNPADLMMSAALAQVLADCSEHYDLVVLDTPPILVAADTVGVAAQAGTVLLVARAGETQIGELRESAKRLAHAGKTATGVLFNALDLSQRHYGSYGYKYGGYRYREYRYSESS
jgi:tyrosine-protein kinase Etk/Wzc